MTVFGRFSSRLEILAKSSKNGATLASSSTPRGRRTARSSAYALLIASGKCRCNFLKSRSPATAKSRGDKGHPCLMPASSWNPSCCVPATTILHLLLLYSSSTNFRTQGGRPSLRMAALRKLWATLGNAALKSKKMAIACRCCKENVVILKSMSTTFCNIDLPGRNPRCSCETHPSRIGSMRSLTAFAMSLLSVLTMLRGLTFSGV